MSVRGRLSLRTRLAVALVALAVFAVGLAIAISHRGLEPRLSVAARERLESSAERMATVAESVYAESAGWTAEGIHDLEHLALLNGLALTLKDAAGSVLEDTAEEGISDLEPAAVQVEVAIELQGQPLGTLAVAPLEGRLFGPEDLQLRDALDRLDVVSGIVAVAAGLVVAFLIAQTLSRPLRRIREAAQRIAHGDLEARISPEGDPELRAVGEALNKLAETLRREEELRKESVADLAHELRTPVSGLLSRIEAAQDGVLSDPKNLEAMHTEAMRLSRLLDDLARLAEAERPGLLIEQRPVDLAAVCNEAAEGLRPLFEQKHIRFAVECEPATVTGDRRRLGQIVGNLLSNALRYTESGGEVRLRLDQRDTSAVVEVEDTGVGIPAADLPRIFERFWRGEKSRSRATGGAGIGLAIVHELVRAHGGRIEVDSEPGIGSRFRVALATRERQSSRAQRLKTKAAAGSGQDDQS